MIQPIITGTGSHIPEIVVANNAFLNAQFFEKNGGKLYKSNKSIIEKFATITGIRERRYAPDDRNASDLAYLAAVEAIADAQVDKETLNYIIVAHNFGDIAFETNRSDQLPTLASRVKSHLGIENPDCVAYDLPFGCPGWVEAMIQASYYIKSGDAQRCLIIGSETLSRIVDPHDRDSMIFSDGAGAAVVEHSTSTDRGILAHKTQTYAVGYTDILSMGSSFSAFINNRDNKYIKMNGRKVYEFALTHVPAVIMSALNKAKVPIGDVKKILIHQANAKMDHAILSRLFQMNGYADVPQNIMPMTINRFGNSSVATVPTLLDLLMKGNLEGHSIKKGDIIVLASVGAGMNINAMVYQI